MSYDYGGWAPTITSSILASAAATLQMRVGLYYVCSPT